MPFSILIECEFGLCVFAPLVVFVVVNLVVALYIFFSLVLIAVNTHTNQPNVNDILPLCSI